MHTHTHTHTHTHLIVCTHTHTHARAHACAQVRDGKMGIVSGRVTAKKGFHGVVWYDPATDAWTQEPNLLKVARTNAGACVFRGNLVCIGGSPIKAEAEADAPKFDMFKISAEWLKFKMKGAIMAEVEVQQGRGGVWGAAGADLRLGPPKGVWFSSQCCVINV